MIGVSEEDGADMADFLTVVENPVALGLAYLRDAVNFPDAGSFFHCFAPSEIEGGKKCIKYSFNDPNLPDQYSAAIRAVKILSDRFTESISDRFLRTN